jgi:hypothetical protein
MFIYFLIFFSFVAICRNEGVGKKNPEDSMDFL